MVVQFRWLFWGLAFVGVGFLIRAADAHDQVYALAAASVKITKTNFVAANGANPPKADPQGTWGKTVKDGVDWKVSWDYGTKVANGAFTLDSKIGIGGSTDPLPDGDGTGTWGATGAENLQNPLPANTVIRAQLLRRENCKWVQKAVDYAPIP